MTHKINLSKVKKCDQSWDEMPQKAGGRLCQKCQNTIVDFRNLSDREVAHIHAFSEGPVCGLYRKRQLKPPVKTERSAQSVKWKAASIGLLSLLSVLDLKAQTTPKSPMIELSDDKHAYRGYQVDFDKKEAIVDSLAGRIIISGRLTEVDSTPIIGGMIIVKDHKVGTYSDVDGYYSLEVTKLFETNEALTLTYKSFGYTDKTVFLLKEEMQEGLKMEINLVLDEEQVEISEFYVRRSPLHKRIWWGIKDFFRGKR